jgi:diketogulonate reductase-like aldo/keto reductase
MNEPVLEALSKKYNKTGAQVLLRWSLQMVCLNAPFINIKRKCRITDGKQGFSPLPKSVTKSRIDENADLYDFELTAEDMKSLDTGEYAPCAWDPTTSRD